VVARHTNARDSITQLSRAFDEFVQIVVGWVKKFNTPDALGETDNTDNQ